MSNSWDYDTFSQYLNTDNEQYDLNEDGFVGHDDYADYLLEQNADAPEAFPYVDMEPSAMSGLNSFSSENFSADQFAQNYEDSTQDITVPGMTGIGSLPGSGYDPMSESGPTGENENYTPEIQTIIDSLGTNNPQTEYTNDGAMGLDDLGDSLLNRDTTLEKIIAAIGTENPAYNYAGDEDYIIGMDDVGNFLQGYGLVTVPDPVIQNDGATSGGQTTQGSGGQTSVTGSLYGDVDPADAAAASTFMGDLSRDDIDFQGYLYGDQINPPGFEKIFGEIERNPFRGDWSEGRYVPYTYDIDLDDPKFEAYEPAREFLSDLFAKAEEAGFDSIERYLLDLDDKNDPSYEETRVLYNYHAGKYEELAPEYQAAQQQAFQEQMQGNNMQEWLGTDDGIKYINQAMGIFAAATGMNVSDMDPSIINLITSAASSGELAAFIGQHGLGAGESFAAAFAEELESFKELTGATNAEIFANAEIVATLKEEATKRTGIEDPGTGDQQEGAGAGLDAGAGAGAGAGDDTITSAFTKYNTVPDDFTFYGIDAQDNFGKEAGSGNGSYGFSFSDFQFKDEYINGVNPIMGYNPDQSTDWSTEVVEAGDSVQGISDLSSDTAALAGFNTDGDNFTRYPKFLIEAANNESSELMKASGGDPFSWWDNLSQANKNIFIESYSTNIRNIGTENNRILEDQDFIAIDNPNKDVYKRNSEGVVTEHLMPLWMIKEQLRSGSKIDHRAWSNLSAEERNRLQSEISGSVDTLGGQGSENLNLVSVTKLVDGNVEIASGIDDEGNVEFSKIEDQRPVYVESPNDPLTFGEFGRALLASGWNSNIYQDTSLGAEGSISKLSPMAEAAWRAAGASDEDVRNFNSTGYLGGLNYSGLGNPWDNFDNESTVFPEEMLTYVFNNIDNFRDLEGQSAYLIPLPGSIDPNQEFGSPTANWTTGGGFGRFATDVVYNTEDIDVGIKDALTSVVNAGNYYDEVNTFGDLENVGEIDWDKFWGVNDYSEGFDPDHSSFWDSDEYGTADQYRNESGTQNMLTATMAGTHGGMGVHEVMAQVGRAYQAYMNELASRPSSELDPDSFFNSRRNDLRENSNFDSIVNLTERLKEQERIEDSILTEWDAAVLRAELQGESDEFKRLSREIEGQRILPGGSTVNYAYGGSVIPVQEDVLLNYASSLPGNPNMGNRSAASSMYGEDSVRQIENLLSGGGYVGGRDGGMDDTVPAMTDGTQPAKLSSGEFVMPADVVSSLGDGNNENGAQKLYEMMDRIRAFKTGSLEQPPPVDDGSVMPV